MENKTPTIYQLEKKLNSIIDSLNDKITKEDDSETRQVMNGKVLAYCYTLHMLRHGIPNNTVE